MNKLIASLVMVGALAGNAANFDVREFGAKGDGVTKDTAAIQAAIDAAEKAGGGTVMLGAGTYLSGTIYLKDNLEFVVGAGATLKASPDKTDYNAADAFPQNWASSKAGDNTSGGHLIVCASKHNVTLRGPGKIYGNSPAFLVDPTTGTNWGDPETNSKRDIPWRPGQMIEIVDSKDIRILDLELADSPYWTCFILNCTRVQIRGCYVHDERAKFRTFNGDGFDIDRCQYVNISDCHIHVEDDCITLRASCANKLQQPQDCAYVTIDNCVLSSACNAIRFGVGEGIVRDITVSNLVIYDTMNAFNFVAAYSPKSRGTDITNVRISNVQLNARCFLWMMHRHSSVALFKDIVFDGITGSTRLPAIIEAKASRPFERIYFNNVDVGQGYTFDNADIRVSGGKFAAIKQ